MHRAESVRHEHLRHGSQLLGKLGVVLLLTDVEAQVLQQHDLTRLQGGGLGLGVLADDILGKDDLLTQQLTQALGDRRERQALLPGALGLAEVGAGDDRRALLEQILNGGQRGHDALVARDLAGRLVLRHVEIAAEQYLLALHIGVGDRHLVVIHGFSSSVEFPRTCAEVCQTGFPPAVCRWMVSSAPC